MQHHFAIIAVLSGRAQFCGPSINQCKESMTVSDSPNSTLIGTALEKLLNDSDLNKVIACLPETLEEKEQHPSLKLLHLRFNEDNPDLDALAEHLSSASMDYVLSRRRRDAFYIELNKAKNSSLRSVPKMMRAVKDAFIEFRAAYPERASEVGEVLAYCIALHHLGAAQLVSKMSLKTSHNMPVHGLDGIHAKFDRGVLTVFFLESKVTSTATSGGRDYAKSLAGFGTNKKQYLREYALIGDVGNLDALEGDERTQLLDFLDPYSNKDLPKRERSVGVICYSEKKLFSDILPIDDGDPHKHEKHFASLYASDRERHQKNLKAQLEKQGVNIGKCSVYLIAVPDVGALREEFYNSLGVEPLGNDGIDFIKHNNESEAEDE